MHSRSDRCERGAAARGVYRRNRSFSAVCLCAGWACLLCFGLIAARADDESLHFQKVTIANLAAGKVHMTRAEVTGEVTLRKKEADGDIHMRISDGQHFVVAECMPEIDGLWQQCSTVKVGSTVTVQGITRFDGEHKWWEVHPVEHLAVGN